MTFKAQLKKSEPALDRGRLRLGKPGESTRKKRTIKVVSRIKCCRYELDEDPSHCTGFID